VESIQIIRLALGVISDRLITIVALLSSCGLTCYTLWAGNWERVATLAIYVVFAYLIVSIKEKPNESQT
jgi:hypothetical protein